MKHYLNFFRIFIPVAYLIGVLGITMKINNPQYFKVAAFFVPLSFLFLMVFHKPQSKRFWLSFALVGFLGFTIEAIGTNTGLVFGQYSYGSSLGVGIFGTPFNMAINWMMLVYLVAYILQNLNVSVFYKSTLSALMLTVFDWFLEPVAVRLQMWQWEQGNPPLHNYVGWFLYSFLVFIIYYRSSPKLENPLAKLYSVMHCLFFIVLNLIFRLY